MNRQATKQTLLREEENYMNNGNMLLVIAV